MKSWFVFLSCPSEPLSPPPPTDLGKSQSATAVGTRCIRFVFPFKISVLF